MQFISPDDLGTAQLLILNKLETCGFLLEGQYEDSNRLQLYVDSVGNEKDGRSQCSLSKYTKIIFHTHPHTVGAPPSAEDILKILKKRDDSFPLISIIFSTWGIWEIQASKKIRLDVEKTNHLIRKINDEFRALLHMTDKGKTYRKGLDEVINNICQTLSYNLFTITNGLAELHMKFTPWNKMSVKGYILNKLI